MFGFTLETLERKPGLRKDADPSAASSARMARGGFGAEAVPTQSSDPSHISFLPAQNRLDNGVQDKTLLTAYGFPNLVYDYRTRSWPVRKKLTDDSWERLKRYVDDQYRVNITGGDVR